MAGIVTRYNQTLFQIDHLPLDEYRTVTEGNTDPLMWSWHGVVRFHIRVEEMGWIYDTPYTYPDSKVHVANMWPTWERQDTGWTHVGHVNLAIWVNMKNM